RTAAFASCTAAPSAERALSRNVGGENVLARASIAAVLATSPPGMPPTPSATAMSVTPATCRASHRSSLRSRTRPGSVRAPTSVGLRDTAAAGNVRERDARAPRRRGARRGLLALDGARRARELRVEVPAGLVTRALQRG